MNSEASLQLLSLSWNCEGLKRNLFNLKNFTDLYKPHLVFLSEPQIYQSDLPAIIKYFRGEYSFTLNSEDVHYPELCLTSSKAKGGTMVMWRKDLDPYITICNPDNASFLPIVLEIPGWIPMIHLAAYLPTAGKDSEYLADLGSMADSIRELQDRIPSAPVFIRGDCNSSKSNSSRHTVFEGFCSDLTLSRVELHHNTYHHFTGQGLYDSELDVLLFSDRNDISEKLYDIICKHDNIHVDSHHDLLLSVCSIPTAVQPTPDKSKNIVAPKLENTRHKII